MHREDMVCANRGALRAFGPKKHEILHLSDGRVCVLDFPHVHLWCFQVEFHVIFLISPRCLALHVLLKLHSRRVMVVRERLLSVPSPRVALLGPCVRHHFAFTYTFHDLFTNFGKTHNLPEILHWIGLCTLRAGGTNVTTPFTNGPPSTPWKCHTVKTC